MSARRRSVLPDETGATAVEFALVFPVLVGLVIGIFQFGWAQHQLSAVRHALHGVSRTVMLNPAMTQSQISEQVRARLGETDPNVTVTRATIATASGTMVRLTGAYTSQIGIPTVAAYPLTLTTTVDAVLPAI